MGLGFSRRRSRCRCVRRNCPGDAAFEGDHAAARRRALRRHRRHDEDRHQSGTATAFWQARIKTKGTSHVYVLQNTIAPGGTFGWHSHPGPSLVIVKSGTATFYLADDPTCSPHVVPAGSGFVDQGHDVHVVRNESTTENLVTVVVSVVPEGFARRIDEPAPANCPNLPNG